MTATMARQGGRLQLEQSDMCLVMNMAEMAEQGLSHAGIDGPQQLITKPCAEVQEEKQCGIVFPGHNKVKAGIEKHLAMVRENQTDGCLP